MSEQSDVFLVDAVAPRAVDRRTLAIEDCADRIARAVPRLTLDQRIAIVRALDALVEDAEWRSRKSEPWL